MSNDEGQRLINSLQSIAITIGDWNPTKPGSGRSLLLSINTLLPFGAMVAIFREGTGRMLRGRSNFEDDKKSEADLLMTIFAVVVELTLLDIKCRWLGVAECQDHCGSKL